MAKSRQTKRKRVEDAHKKSAGQSSQGPDEAVHNTETAQKTVDNVPRNETAALLSLEEAVLEEAPLDSDADIVFQCASCRSVIGDTQSEYQAHLEFQTLSLKAASNVSIEKELHVSKKGFDSGCTYRKVVCSKCRTHLGQTYTSTTVELDNLRSAYTFMHTALVSYQLGSSKTMDGHDAPNPERRGNIREQKLGTAQHQHQAVSLEAFDALDAHVSTLTDATNKLTEGFNQNRDSICGIKQVLDTSNESVVEIRAGLEHVQNMMLLWEERFQRLDACEQDIAKLASDCRRYDLCERRVSQLGEMIRNPNFAPGTAGTDRPQTASMKVMPTIQNNPASPTRSSLKRRR